MPLYDYRCTQCGTVSEVRHGFDQTHAEPCPSCGGTMARVFNPAPIVFKGSGFYATDSRKNSASSPAKSEGSSTASSESSPAPATPSGGDAKKSSGSAA